MRYIVLILLFVAANQFLPFSTLGGGQNPVPDVAAAQPAVDDAVIPPTAPGDDPVDIEFVAFQTPPRLAALSKPASGAPDAVPATFDTIAGRLSRASATTHDGDTGTDEPVDRILALATGTTEAMAKPTAMASPTSDLAAADPDAGAQAADATGLREVTARLLNVRKGPSSRTPVIGVLKIGNRIAISGEGRNGWVQVTTNGEESLGWVFARYLKPADDA